jgi:F0F1-type ATP synthase membrane subunit b/b'
MPIISLILLQIFIFAGLAFFLRHLLTRNVTSATSHLQGMIRDNTEKQDEIKKKLGESKKQYEDTIRKAEKEAQDIKERYQKALEAERDKIISQAHEQSEELLDRADKTCEAINAELDKRVNARAVERAGDLVCKVLPPEVCRVMHALWMDALIAEGLSGIDRLRVPEEVNSAEVLTAFALSDEQKQKLLKKLEEGLDRSIGIHEKVQPELIAGMTISIGNLVFDGSFIHRMREVTRESIASA